MDEFPGGKALVYNSDNIHARRQRVLREARKMISESGLEGFSVRELCARADIAQKTLYNAFGGKEGVIALAIRQFMTDFNSNVQYRFDGLTLEGRLERLIKVHSRNIQIRPYTTAIISVYNSFTAGREIRKAIRNISDIGSRPFAESLRDRGELAEGVTPEHFVQLGTTMVYAILTDWCLGDLPDERLVDTINETFLVVLAGCTKGQVRQDAERWLEDLRGNRPGWLAMRKMSEVEPRELRETERRTEAPPRRKSKSGAVASR